jgi:ATP-dependent Clp protease ATP-binding subunit ClpC
MAPFGSNIGPIQRRKKMSNGSDYFTKEAENIIELAHQQAREFNHNYVDTEHILLALTADEGSAANALSDCGLEPDDLRKSLKFVIGPGDPVSEKWYGLTSRAKRVVELASVKLAVLIAIAVAQSTSC